MITAKGMRRPHEVVWRVYRALRDRGYNGPPPVLNDMWNHWFAGGGGVARDSSAA